MKRILTFCLIAIVVSLASCKKEKEEVDPDVSDTTDGYAHEEPSDYVWEESSVYTINLNGTSIQTSAEGVIVNDRVAIIQRQGNYRITGNLDNGHIIIDTDTSSLVRIILNECTITNNTGPAILIDKSKKTIVNLVEGTINSLSDGQEYSNPSADPNAVLFSKSDLTIFGQGTLNINANFKDGISGKDGVIVKSGNINITSKDDGLCGKDYLIIHDGIFDITSQGDGIRSDDLSNSAVGYVLINNGNFNIVSSADGITAVNYIDIKNGKFDILSGGGSSVMPGETSCKGIKGLMRLQLAAGNYTINSSDDALHSNKSIEIISGTYTISSATNGIHSDESVTITDGDLTIDKSDEGIESKFITVNSGNIIVYSSDDSFNATAGQSTENDDQSCVYVNGGTIVLSGTNGDPLDSNGSIIMTDGKVIIHGPTSAPEVAIDYNGTFNINGGFLIASGTNSDMTIPPSASSMQNSIKVTFKDSHSAGSLFHIRDSDGKELITYKPERSYQSMIFTSAELVTGKTYYIYVSGSHEGTEEHGLFENGSYSPGIQLTSFTISEKITIVNNI